MNIVILSGNVGKDPIIKTTQTGKKVANFSLATTYGSGDKATTDWHNIVVWEKQAEFVEKHIKKGTKVIVNGRISNRDYTDADGVKKYITEIVCNDVEFAGNKQASYGEEPIF